MLTLALTGGIGSGKSYVRDVFLAAGVPVYDTDSRARELCHQSPGLKAALSAMFGKDIYDADGRLDRKALAGMVFSDVTLLRALEAIVYSALTEDLECWKSEHRLRGDAVTLVESALILEKNDFLPMVDKVITVSAPQELRISRTMARDSCSREQVLSRMRNQHTDGWREERSDFVVVSDGRTPLLPQVVRILSEVTDGPMYENIMYTSSLLF